MKKILVLFLLFFGASVLNAGQAVQLKPNNFQYSAYLEGPLKQGALYQILLPSDILQKSSADYRDVRLFAPDNREIPFVVLENEYPGEVVEMYPLEIIEYIDTPASAVVTAKLPEKYRPISLIDLDIADRDFKKGFLLYGSNDRKRWDALANGEIYDFSSQVDLRKTVIDFTKSDYRFYRIELINIKQSSDTGKSINLKYEGLDFSVNNIQDKKLRINKIEGRTGVKKDRTVVYDEKTFTNLAASLDENRRSVIILEAALPFDRIHFEIANPYYYRPISIYYSDTGKKDSYNLLAQSSIYSFPLSGLVEAKNYVAYKTPKHGYYKLVIDNRNNPPLEIKSIRFEWVQKNLYFIALSDASKYALGFGNNTVIRPDYDLSSFIGQGNWFRQNYVKLNMSPIIQNANYSPGTPLDKKARIEKLALTAVIIMLVVGISFWLYRLLGKAATKDNIKTD